jgi:hypothetical protein
MSLLFAIHTFCFLVGTYDWSDYLCPTLQLSALKILGFASKISRFLLWLACTLMNWIDVRLSRLLTCAKAAPLSNTLVSIRDDVMYGCPRMIAWEAESCTKNCWSISIHGLRGLRRRLNLLSMVRVDRSLSFLVELCWHKIDLRVMVNQSDHGLFLLPDLNWSLRCCSCLVSSRTMSVRYHLFFFFLVQSCHGYRTCFPILFIRLLSLLLNKVHEYSIMELLLSDPEQLPQSKVHMAVQELLLKDLLQVSFLFYVRP